MSGPTNVLPNAKNVLFTGDPRFAVTNINAQQISDILELLSKQACFRCLYNAADRFNAPNCAPNTREKILEDIEKWIKDDKEGAAALMWLFGAAGAGKSAIAQKIVEICIKKGLYVASFFFSRIGVPERSDGDRLIATIVWQIMEAFPKTKPRIAKVLRDKPHLFETSRKNQLQELLIRPLKTKWYQKLFQLISPPKARLIVIDGLDECSDPEIQKDILKILADTLSLLPYPFRILIVSRPEAHILETVRTYGPFQSIAFTKCDLGLDADADSSVRNYFEQSFLAIKSTHRLRSLLDPSWPSSSDIEILVGKASGQFIYATTVVKYVERSKARPDDCLNVVLGIEDCPDQDDPFAELNMLYMLIFKAATKESWGVLHPLFGILYFFTLRQHKYLATNLIKLAAYLNTKPAPLIALLDDFLSLLDVPEDPTQPIRVYHASLFDFLLDPSRSKQYFLDISVAHTRLAEFFMPPPSQAVNEINVLTFLCHCKHARLTDAMENYLETFQYLYDHKNRPYSGYLPFIYYSYLSVLIKMDRNHRLYNTHLGRLKGTLTVLDSAGHSTKRLPAVTPLVDLGEDLSNDVLELFTSFAVKHLTNETHTKILSNICGFVQRPPLQTLELTLPTLKHLILATLPVCQPSTDLYRAYGTLASVLAHDLKDATLDVAIRSRLSVFMKLSAPRGSEDAYQEFSKAWSPLLTHGSQSR